MKPASRSDCPLVFALDLFGDRWTLLVIRDLLQGKQHFDEFLSSPEGVASNILADRLKRLTELGLVKRYCDNQDKRRFLYRLTPLGKSTRAFLLPMIRWSSIHFRKPHQA
jgi:DNA-binding HxlR family transcriptional regulator